MKQPTEWDRAYQTLTSLAHQAPGEDLSEAIEILKHRSFWRGVAARASQLTAANVTRLSDSDMVGYENLLSFCEKLGLNPKLAYDAWVHLDLRKHPATPKEKDQLLNKKFSAGDIRKRWGSAGYLPRNDSQWSRLARLWVDFI